MDGNFPGVSLGWGKVEGGVLPIWFSLYREENSLQEDDQYFF